MPARSPHPVRDIADFLGAGDLATPEHENLCLVADIGGTNARFGLVSDSRDEPREVRNLRCADYPDLVAAIEDYLGRIPGLPRPQAACVAGARRRAPAPRTGTQTPRAPNPPPSPPPPPPTPR
ncbi:glucokinase, partial [Nocardia tengchongensis]|uniref:glucokinase n=1 Tax=Nocardia tengchongensis TaxID=2055889 RepID=UPI00367C860C